MHWICVVVSVWICCRRRSPDKQRFKHTAFQYDTDGDTVDDAPFPRCVTLTHGDVVPPIGNPMHDDSQYFWCTALPLMKDPHFNAPRVEMRLDTLKP